MKVIVAGGSGFIGRALVEALLRAGDEAVVLSRRAAEAERRLADGAQVAQWTGVEVEPALGRGRRRRRESLRRLDRRRALDAGT